MGTKDSTETAKHARLKELRKEAEKDSAQEKGSIASNFRTSLRTLTAASPERLEEEKQRRANVERLEAAALVNTLWANSGFPRLHKAKMSELELDGDWGRACSQVGSIVSAGGIVGLVGKRGSGKTQLATVIARDVCGDTQRSVRYMTAMGVIDFVRAGYGGRGGPSESDQISMLGRSALLVIDEFEYRRETDEEQRIVTAILDKRYGNMVPTIIISNMVPEEFAESVGPKIMSRLKECGDVILCDGESFRKNS